MDDLWSWITNLPNPREWVPSDPAPSLNLASAAGKSIVLKAERTAGSDADALVTFTISLHGFHHPSVNTLRTLWLSDPFPFSSPKTTTIHLSLQLLDEVVAHSPSSAPSLAKLDPIDTPQYYSPAFLSLALLCRLFWLCAVDAPAEAGFLFFQSLGPSLERALNCGTAIGAVLISVGADREERFMRSVGYMLAKWCILRELHGNDGPKLGHIRPVSFAAEVHGLWVLKGFAPIAAMDRIASAGSVDGPRETAIRYALAHQQLEVVVQLEYSVSEEDPRFILVSVRVDNIRIRVVRLGFRNDDDDNSGDGVEMERHFPSRVRVLVGPEAGAAYAAVLSLGRSTGNPERETETTRTTKGSFGKDAATVEGKARSSVREKARSWRWEQEAEGSAGVFEGALEGSGGMMRGRYRGAGRAFSRAGGLVVAGDELAEGVRWRIGREMEGRVLRWRMKVGVWLSYAANEAKTDYCETRCVEWKEEMDLQLNCCWRSLG